MATRTWKDYFGGHATPTDNVSRLQIGEAQLSALATLASGQNPDGTAYSLPVTAGAQTAPSYVRIEDATNTANVLAVNANGSINVASSGTAGDNADAIAAVSTGEAIGVSRLTAFNGTTWDRVYSLGSAGDGLGVAKASQPPSTYGNAQATAGTATVTFAAVVGQKHHLTMAIAGYASAPVTAGAFSISDNGTQFTVITTSNTPYFQTALPPAGISQAAVNTPAGASLASGGAAIVGWVFCAKQTY